MEFQLSDTSKYDLKCGKTEWTSKCRNCQYLYPKDLKDVVTRFVVRDDIPMIKAVTRACLENGITKYCCINNFKVKCIKDDIPNIVRETFFEIRPSVFIDKTMTDWMDITWDDNVRIEDNTNHDNSISLFDL